MAHLYAPLFDSVKANQGSSQRRATQSRLVEQPQSKLDMPRTARADHRIGHVRRGAGTAELRDFRIEAHGAAVLRGRSGGEVRTVKEIKELHTELCSQPLLEFPILRH